MGVQKVQISYASLSVFHGQNCIGQRFLVRLSNITHPAMLPLVDLAPLPAVPLSDLATMSVEPMCRGDEAWPEEAGSLCSSYSLASCLSLQVGRVQERCISVRINKSWRGSRPTFSALASPSPSTPTFAQQSTPWCLRAALMTIIGIEPSWRKSTTTVL